jgi:hypothetical protein
MACQASKSLPGFRALTGLCAIGAAPMTLRKHFADELVTPHIKANARVSETAYNMAISGKCPGSSRS